MEGSEEAGAPQLRMGATTPGAGRGISRGGPGPPPRGTAAPSAGAEEGRIQTGGPWRCGPSGSPRPGPREGAGDLLSHLVRSPPPAGKDAGTARPPPPPCGASGVGTHRLGLGFSRLRRQPRRRRLSGQRLVCLAVDCTPCAVY